MTVKELIEKLQKLPGNMEVRSAEAARDYCRTTLASRVDIVELATVEYSEYFQCHVLPRDGENYDEKADPMGVVLLR